MTTGSASPSTHTPSKLEVGRVDLVQALRVISRATGRHTSDACLTFEDGFLSIEAGETIARAPALGTWPAPIFVGASWVRILANKMPPGDPLIIHIEADRIHLGRYSEICSLTRAKPSPSLVEKEIRDRITQAAQILEPLHIKRKDIEELISYAQAERSDSWSQEEKKMLSMVAKAWVLLAPMGIETPDLHRLIQSAVRNAWK